MGCVQSQPSHPSKHHSSSNSPRHAQSTSRRRSQEFYHQYQPATPTHNHPHNYNQKINHSASSSNYSSAVISSNEGQRQRVPSKNHNRKDQHHRVPSPEQQLLSTTCDKSKNRSQITHSTPAKRNQSSLETQSPNKYNTDDKEANNSHNSSNFSKEHSRSADRSSSSTGGVKGEKISKDDSTNEESSFRRQHFDRNSILRTSKKRSRKASVASNSAGTSTPGKNGDPNSNISVKDQNNDTFHDKQSSSNGLSKALNNSNLNQTSLLDKKTNISAEVNALYRENKKNIEAKTPSVGDKKYISTSHNQYSDFTTKIYGLNNYCDKDGERVPMSIKSDKSLSKRSNFNECDSQNINSVEMLSSYNHEKMRNDYNVKENINEVNTFSASDNVAALLGKSNSTKTSAVNNVKQTTSQQNQVGAKITKSRTTIKSNGVKESTAPSGSTVIRTRREAMRQAEEEEAAKNSGRTARRQNSSNNGNDNNRGINAASKKNEKQDRITQEEDCGRLI